MERAIIEAREPISQVSEEDYVKGMRRMQEEIEEERARRKKLKPNRSVEQRTFGAEIDPDRVSGATGRSLDAAMDRYQTFQQKAPQAVVRVQHDPPKLVVPVGDALSVMYRSSKWTKEGEEEEDIDYKHRHEPSEGREYAVRKGVRLYENARYAEPGLKRNAGTEKLPMPASPAWARLGYCLGFFVRRDDDEQIHEVNPRNTWLLSVPDGHMLAVYSPKPQPNGDVGFLCVMSGGKLRVLKEGIDG
jgi:hypothetical protein